MGIVDTNSIQIAQSSDNGSSWRNLIVSDITRFNNENNLVPPEVISRSRQNLKSKIVSSTSGVGYNQYLGIDSLDLHASSVFFTRGRNRQAMYMRATAASSGVGGGYTVPALASDSSRSSDAQFNAHLLLTSNHLLWVSGFRNAGNNGLKTLAQSATSGATNLRVDGLVGETGATIALVSLAGYRVPGSTNITWTWSGSTRQATMLLPNASNIAGLHEGMFVNIGSIASQGGDIQNAFQNVAANDMFGSARILSIGTSSIIFDHVAPELEFTAASPSTPVDIVFGWFPTNEQRDSSLFVRPSLLYERRLEDYLDDPVNPGQFVDGWQYSEGNLIDSLVFNAPAADYVTMTMTGLGTNTPLPVQTRRANAVNAVDPILTETLVTRTDVARAAFTSDGTDMDLTFFDITYTLSNNIGQRDAIGSPNTWRVNPGNFSVSVSSEVSFSDIAYERAIDRNETVSLTTLFTSVDGIAVFHVPSMSVSKDSETYTRNDVISISGTANAFQDSLFKTSCSFSIWAVPFSSEQV